LSAFAVVYERSNTPGDSVLFNGIMERLNHRGPDGSDVVSAGNITMGHWHFWTTPEEVGERQPLSLNGYPFKLVLDGRLDNREELFAKLRIAPAEGISLSDAALILHAYTHWGERCFEHFIGEFALVIFDEQHNQMICARDHLGDRTLFYAAHGAQFVIASEPWAVTGAGGNHTELNEGGVAHYFALKAPEDGQTLFKDVYELLPAHVLVVDASGQNTRRYWQPNSSARMRFKSDEEYAGHFRALLDESIRCRLRSTTLAGVLMSGGLDSTTLACLAAPMLAPQPLTTISCVFDELPDCDEREYIDAVTTRWATHPIQVPCNDAWPLRDWQNWPFNPNYPSGNAYRLIRERAYQRAQKEGLRVLLTGDFGDHLYSGAEDWLGDLLIEGRFIDAGKEITGYLHSYGIRQTLAAIFLRRIARRVLDLLPGARRLRHKDPPPSPWLTPFSIESLPSHSEKNERESSLLGSLTAQGSSMETFNASRNKIELRTPYRDRRLVEFMLALPAHQLYRHGLYRHILRNAMRDILPEKIRVRPGKTSWISLFFRGMEHEKETLQNCIQDPQAFWRKFVRSDWILSRWNIPFSRNQDGADKIVPWLCVAYEAWCKHFVFSA
jgi:asparagine synthase (glutamine-hydrolysing)